MFVGDDRGHRAWHKDRFQAPVRLEGFKESVVQVAVDAPRRALFTLGREAVRRWTLPD